MFPAFLFDCCRLPRAGKSCRRRQQAAKLLHAFEDTARWPASRRTARCQGAASALAPDQSAGSCMLLCEAFRLAPLHPPRTGARRQLGCRRLGGKASPPPGARPDRRPDNEWCSCIAMAGPIVRLFPAYRNVTLGSCHFICLCLPCACLPNGLACRLFPVSAIICLSARRFSLPVAITTLSDYSHPNTFNFIQPDDSSLLLQSEI